MAAAGSHRKSTRKPVPDKSRIIGLPPEADLQWSGDRLAVFYRYRTKDQEKRKYLGSVTDMTFRPNIEYQTNPGSFEIPQKKAVGRRAVMLREQKPVSPDKERLRFLGPEASYNAAVGGPLLLMQCWQEARTDQDLFDALIEVLGESQARALYPKIVTAALFMAHDGGEGRWEIESWCRAHIAPALLTDQGFSDLCKMLGAKADELKAAFMRRRPADTRPDLWESLDVKGKSIRVSFDSSLCRPEVLKGFCRSGTAFLAAGNADLRIVSDCIRECAASIQDYANWNMARKCFGMTKEALLDPNDPASRVYVHVFLDPKAHAREMDRFSNALEKAKAGWKSGKGRLDADMAPYFEAPETGRSLEPRNDVITEKFRSLGSFALVTNYFASCHDALMNSTLPVGSAEGFRTARSQAGAGSEDIPRGKAFIHFYAAIGADAVKQKLAQWKKEARSEKKALPSFVSNADCRELFDELECVRLQKTSGCSPYVENATKRIRDIMRRLGAEDLYDDPQKIIDLMLECPPLEADSESSEKTQLQNA